MNSLYTLVSTWLDIDKDIDKIIISNRTNHTEQKILNICNKHFNDVKLSEHNTRLELSDGKFDTQSWFKFMICCGKLKYSIIKITINDKTYNLDDFLNTFVDNDIIPDINEYKMLLIKQILK